MHNSFIFRPKVPRLREIVALNMNNKCAKTGFCTPNSFRDIHFASSRARKLTNVYTLPNHAKMRFLKFYKMLRKVQASNFNMYIFDCPFEVQKY